MPRDIKDDTVLLNAKWTPLKYFCCFRIQTIAHKTFYNLDLDEIHRLVVKTSSNYALRKSLNIDVSRPRTELERKSFTHRAAVAWNAVPH